MQAQASSFRFFLWTLFLVAASGANAAALGAGYSLRAGPAGAVREDFDSMGAQGALAPGNGARALWSVNVSNVERATNLLASGAFPANGGLNGGPWPDSGLAPATDRALGVYAGAAGDNPRTMTMMVTNLTGGDLARFYLRFDAEVWIVRNSGAFRYGGLQAAFSTDNFTYRDLGNEFEAVFQYPDVAEDASSNYWVDGNAPANSRRHVGGWVTNVFIPAGGVFYARFEAWGANLADPDGAGPYVNRQIGVAVDNIHLEAEGSVAIPAGALAFRQGVFSFTLPTVAGKNYTLEHSPALPATEWSGVMNLTGGGQPAVFSHTPAGQARGFYRLRVD